MPCFSKGKLHSELRGPDGSVVAEGHVGLSFFILSWAPLSKSPMRKSKALFVGGLSSPIESSLFLGCIKIYAFGFGCCSTISRSPLKNCTFIQFEKRRREIRCQNLKCNRGLSPGRERFPFCLSSKCTAATANNLRRKEKKAWIMVREGKARDTQRPGETGRNEAECLCTPQNQPMLFILGNTMAEPSLTLPAIFSPRRVRGCHARTLFVCLRGKKKGWLAGGRKTEWRKTFFASCIYSTRDRLRAGIRTNVSVERIFFLPKKLFFVNIIQCLANGFFLIFSKDKPTFIYNVLKF